MAARSTLARLGWLLLLAVPAGGGAQTAADRRVELTAMRSALRLELALLEADRSSFEKARREARQSRDRADQTASQLDGAVAAPTPAAEEVERLLTLESAARAAASAAAERADEVAGRIVERVRTISSLREEMDRIEATAAIRSDPVSGRWHVVLQPGPVLATFELHLDGTVVTGSYQVIGGGGGSLRGTYVAGGVRLERIDGEAGFDAVFRGSLDVQRGIMKGFWTPTDVSGGKPGGGDWSAVKIVSDEEKAP